MRRGGAYLALASLALLWGYSWVMVKVATRDASPVAVAALRSALGAATLLAFLAIARRPLRPPPFGPTAVYGLLQTTLFTFLVSQAVALGGAGKVAILAYTMPFWLALLAWPVLGERIHRARWIALAIAAAGLGCIVWPLDASSAPASGLAILAGVMWAASAVWVIRLRRAGHYDLLSLTTWQMVWGSVGLGVVALVTPFHVRWTGGLLWSIGFLAVVANAVGWALWLYVLSRLPAAVAGLGSLATPVMGVLMAAAQLGEVPSRGELAGVGLVVAALVVNAVAAPPASARASTGRGSPR